MRVAKGIISVEYMTVEAIKPTQQPATRLLHNACNIPTSHSLHNNTALCDYRRNSIGWLTD